MTGFSALPLDASSRTQKFTGKASIRGPKWTHLPTLTIGFLGVQIFWSVEMGYASPYLLSLGLSKSSMSLVFLAGPLSGLVMQPLIGALADTSTSRFGRRRPPMLIGALACVLAMLLLGYTRPFASLFTARSSPANDTLTTALAVLAIYVIDFAINAVMAMDRALLVDTLPPAQQAAGNAWAARMFSVGAVVGFFVGSVPLPQLLPFLGTTQLQVLSAVVSLLLLAGHATTALCVRERILLKSTEHSKTKQPNAFVREIKALWSNLLTLPPVIRQICIIQFFAWIAWFPILFYTTLYIGDLYRRSTPSTATPTAADRDAEATRLGTRALFFSALLSLTLNLVLPFFVATPATRSRSRSRSHSHSRTSGFHTPRADTDTDADAGGGWAWLAIPSRLKMNLATLWAVSHLVLGGCMLGTLFTDSVTGATVLITLTGFSWAITQWAPFSLLAEAILTTPGSEGVRDSILLADARTPVDDLDVEARGDGEEGERAVFLPSGGGGGGGVGARDKDGHGHERDHGPHSDDEDEDEDEDEHEHDPLDREHDHDHDHDPHPPSTQARVLGNHHARVSRLQLQLPLHDGEGDGDGDGEWEDVEDDFNRDAAGGRSESGGGGGGGLSAKAGIILGIHNIFIVVPQFLITGLSAVVFAVFDPAGATARPHVSPHPAHLPPPASEGVGAGSNATVPVLEVLVRALVDDTAGVMRGLVKDAAAAEAEAEREARGGGSNSVVYIFRFGGVSALIAFVLCWRLARELRHR